MIYIRDILVVTQGYPSPGNPYYPFVGQLCEEFSRQGRRVTVVCPQSLFSAIKHNGKIRPVHCKDDGNGLVDVYRPYYITAPYKYKRINNLFFRWTLSFFLKKHALKFDAIYCHFWQSGYNAFSCVKSTKKPLFVATGESEIEKMYERRHDDAEFCSYHKGVIAVSTKNRDESIRLGLTKEDKCMIIPNAVNLELFHKRNRIECREKLGLSKDDFIVAFVGWFIERKGPLRVAASINKVGNVKSFFIGKGEQDPQCEGILFKGALAHEEIPLYLGAADIFVLPTLHEGCCNAVVEAMACGLPVVSSNLPFNWDVLNEMNSIMVDPNNIDEISNAIRVLKEDSKLRKELSECALENARKLSLQNRAKKILEYMEERVRLIN